MAERKANGEDDDDGDEDTGGDAEELDDVENIEHLMFIGGVIPGDGCEGSDERFDEEENFEECAQSPKDRGRVATGNSQCT